MNEEKLEEIKEWVEGKLGSFSHLKKFKIGKTDKQENRFANGYQGEGYDKLLLLASGSPKAVNEGEMLLVDYFLNHSIWKDKCANERNGGGGNPNADHLYLVVDYEVDDINFLDEGLYQDEWEIKKLD